MTWFWKHIVPCKRPFCGPKWLVKWLLWVDRFLCHFAHYSSILQKEIKLIKSVSNENLNESVQNRNVFLIMLRWNQIIWGSLKVWAQFLYGSCRKCKYVDLLKFYYVSKQVLNNRLKKFKNNLIYKTKWATRKKSSY